MPASNQDILKNRLPNSLTFQGRRSQAGKTAERVSVVSLSNIYDVSLDALIKGDEKMLEHLEESTNIVKSNKKLLFAIIANILTAIAMIGLSVIVPSNEYVLAGVFCVMVIAASFLMNQIVKRI